MESERIDEDEDEDEDALKTSHHPVATLSSPPISLYNPPSILFTRIPSANSRFQHCCLRPPLFSLISFSRV